MADVKKLKEELTSYLCSQLENPPEGGVPKPVLDTAVKLVKDFQHEIEDDNANLGIQDEKLRKFIHGKSAGVA